MSCNASNQQPANGVAGSCGQCKAALMHGMVDLYQRAGVDIWQVALEIGGHGEEFAVVYTAPSFELAVAAYIADGGDRRNVGSPVLLRDTEYRDEVALQFLELNWGSLFAPVSREATFRVGEFITKATSAFEAACHQPRVVA